MMVRLSKKNQKIVEKAKRDARKAEERRSKRKSYEQKPQSSAGRWVVDEWGEQGEVFFDGKLYWIVTFSKSGLVIPRGLSEEEWIKRQKSGTLVTEKLSLSTRKTTKSTKGSKRKRIKKSPTKSGKTVTPGTQRKSPLISTSRKQTKRQ